MLNVRFKAYLQPENHRKPLHSRLDTQIHIQSPLNQNQPNTKPTTLEAHVHDTILPLHTLFKQQLPFYHAYPTHLTPNSPYPTHITFQQKIQTSYPTQLIPNPPYPPFSTKKPHSPHLSINNSNLLPHTFNTKSTLSSIFNKATPLTSPFNKQFKPPTPHN